MSYNRLFSFPSFKKIFAKFLNSWLKCLSIISLLSAVLLQLHYSEFKTHLSLFLRMLKTILRILKKSDVDFYMRWERPTFWEEDKSFGFGFDFDLFLEFFRMSKCDFVCVCYDMFPKFSDCMFYIQNVCYLVSIFAEQRHSMRYLS